MCFVTCYITCAVTDEKIDPTFLLCLTKELEVVDGFCSSNMEYAVVDCMSLTIR